MNQSVVGLSCHGFSTRIAPLLSITIALTVAMAPCAAHATLLYSNLLPYSGYSYYNGGAIVAGSAASFGYYALTMSFNPSATAQLTSIDLGVTYQIESSSQDVMIKLEGDNPATHSPDGIVLASGIVTCNALFGASNSALTAFTPNGVPIVLDSSATCWVVSEPTEPGTYNVWNGIQNFGRAGLSTDGINFATEIRQGYALQVSGTPVPEPATCGLLLLASVGFAFRRRHSRTSTS